MHGLANKHRDVVVDKVTLLLVSNLLRDRAIVRITVVGDIAVDGIFVPRRPKEPAPGGSVEMLVIDDGVRVSKNFDKTN